MARNKMCFRLLFLILSANAVFNIVLVSGRIEAPKSSQITCFSTLLAQKYYFKYLRDEALNCFRVNCRVHSSATEFDTVDFSLEDESTNDIFPSEKGTIEDIFGKGKGPHAGKRVRKHKNKYSKRDTNDLDPFEQQLKISKQEEEKRQKKNMEETREEERQRIRLEDPVRERGKIMFPSEEDIDPYDPTTFGFIQVGEVMGAHGIKGEVKVRTNTDFGPERLCQPGIKHIQQPGRRYPREIELQSGRQQVDEVYIVKFKGITNRELAQDLKKYQLFVKEQEEVNLDEGEFMVQELVGLKVYLSEDISKCVGTIAGLVLAEDLSSVPGMSDLLEVEYEVEEDDPGSYCATKTMSCLIPFVKEIVPYVDIQEGKVMITPPPGLLDLAVVKKEKVFIRGYLPERAQGVVLFE